VSVELFRRLKPLYGKEIERLWVAYQFGTPEERREIEELLTMLAITKQGMMIGDERLVLDAPPPLLIGRGEFTIGNITYPGLPPYPLRVARNELLRHVFILGPTGTGKSTLLITLLVQLQAAQIPVMIFDFKRNYRCLLHAAGSDALIVFTVGRNTAPLCLNVLTPPIGVAFEEWAEALSDSICTSYLLLHGARNVLKEALTQAHEEHGETATLAHAHALLSAELGATRSGSRRYGWLESATRSVEELTKGGFGRALNASTATPVAELLARSVVFELQGFGDDQKRFFCLFWLQVVLLLRKHSTAPREHLQHVLVFDEGHNVFPRERLGEVSVPARLAREVREFGEAIIAATQQADVSESLIANSGFKFILRCDYPKDVQFASQLLQIEPRWLPKLALGTGIARLPVRFYTPVLFTFDAQPIKNTLVADAEVAARWQQQHLPPAPTPPPTPRALTNHEEALLHDVAARPISTITNRYARLGWNAKTGNTVKNALLTQGYATFHPVTTPTGQVKILSLTPAAIALLERAGITLSRSRHGGPEHEYWKFVVADRLRKHGFTVTEEYGIGDGRTVDVHARRGNEEIVVEVETGRSDIAANIRKCVGLQAKIIFVFTSAGTRDAYAAPVRGALPDALVLITSEIARLP
jgi:hypothetical protein